MTEDSEKGSVGKGLAFGCALPIAWVIVFMMFLGLGPFFKIAHTRWIYWPFAVIYVAAAAAIVSKFRKEQPRTVQGFLITSGVGLLLVGACGLTVVGFG